MAKGGGKKSTVDSTGGINKNYEPPQELQVADRRIRRRKNEKSLGCSVNGLIRGNCCFGGLDRRHRRVPELGSG